MKIYFIMMFVTMFVTLTLTLSPEGDTLIYEQIYLQ